MKRKKLLFTLLFLSIGFYEIKEIYKEPTIFITGKREYSVKDKHQFLKQAASQITGLRITPSEFADAALIVLFCESRLRTDAEGCSGSQGINQLTLETRKLLGIPENILKDDFETQVTYFVKFINATNKGHLIKDSVSLHALNFSPSNAHLEILCNASSGLKGLDINGNGVIDKDDLYLFQRTHVSENKYVEKIFNRSHNNV